MDDMIESAWNDSIQNLKNRIDSLDSNRQMQAFLFIRRIFDFANQMLDPVPVVPARTTTPGNPVSNPTTATCPKCKATITLT
jgi:hypothetical protein